MDEVRFDNIDKKLDRISERINSIDVTLGYQHESLKEHIRRTTQLEDRVTPMEKHVIMVSGAAKLLGMIVGAVGLLAAVVEILMYFRK